MTRHSIQTLSVVKININILHVPCSVQQNSLPMYVLVYIHVHIWHITNKTKIVPHSRNVERDCMCELYHIATDVPDYISCGNAMLSADDISIAWFSIEDERPKHSIMMWRDLRGLYSNCCCYYSATKELWRSITRLVELACRLREWITNTMLQR
jgi:hypothetical protein